MILRQLMLVVSSLFFNLKRKHSGVQEDFTDAVRKSISAEVSQLSFRLLAGSVLVGLSIFCLTQFGRALQVWFSQLENGFVYEIIFFGGIAFVSLWGLYRLFHPEESQIVDAEPTFQNSAVNSLSSEFVKGFLNGLHSSRSTVNANLNVIDQKNIY